MTYVSPSAMELTQVDEALSQLVDRVAASIYFGRKYNVGEPWEIKLEASEQGTILSIAVTGKTLSEALCAAWTKLNLTAKHGLGPNALAPPVEHKALAQTTDDEIPF